MCCDRQGLPAKMVLRMRSTLIVRAQNQNGSQIQALTAMACVCNHGPSVDSHHHCTAPLQHSSMTPPGPVHHCESEHAHSSSHIHPPGHGYCPSCHPHAPTGIVSHPPQCACCSHSTGHQTSPLPPPHVNSPSWFPSPSTPSHPHSYTSQPHTPTSHHPPPHVSHPRTLTSQHPSPHTSLPSSHPHIPMSHPPTSHHHSPTSYHPSPVHQPTSHLHRAPFVASPLHHTHSWHHSHSPTFHTPQHSHHRSEPHPPSGECCTNSMCRILPQHPKSVCQVHPTRRQLIPASPCLDSTENHPPAPQFVGTPPRVVHHTSSQLPNANLLSPLSSYAQPLTQTLEHQVEVVPERVERQAQGFSDATATPPIVQPTVYSTPPSNLHNSQAHSQQQMNLNFSPYDGAVLSRFSTDFELAVPPTLNPINVNAPVNHVQVHEPNHPSILDNISDLPSSAPPCLPGTQSSSFSQSSRARNNSSETLRSGAKHPLPAFNKKRQGQDLSTKTVTLSDSLLVGNEKIGREAIVLQHCAKGRWKTDSLAACFASPLSWDEFEKKHIKESDRNKGTSSSSWKEETKTVAVEVDSEDSWAKESDRATVYEDMAKVEVAPNSRICTRSRAKLLSDSEMSQSESEPTTATAATSWKSGSKRQECQNRVEDKGTLVGGEKEGDVVDDPEGGDGNDTLVAVKTETRSPIMTRTRSRFFQDESSQSESDIPNTTGERIPTESASIPQEGSKGVKREKRRKRKGKQRASAEVEEGESESESFSIATRLRRRNRTRPHVLETSQSESEPSVTVIPPQPQQQQGAKQQQQDQHQHQQTGQELKQQSKSESKPVSLDSLRVDVSSVSESQLTVGAVVSTQAASETTVKLTDWYIRIVGKNLVIVEGIKNDDKKRTWHSGPIVKRLAPRLVATRSGTTYLLEGPLHRPGLEKLEIEDLCAEFEDGFPEHWLSIIHDYLLQRIKSSKERSAASRLSEEEREKGQERRDVDTEEEERVEVEERRDVEEERAEVEERRDLDTGEEGRVEVEEREEEGRSKRQERQCSKVKSRTSKRAKRWRKQQAEDSASDRCEGGRGGKSEGETEREENVGRVVMSTPVVINGSTSEANADEEHTPIHFKTEEDPVEFTTPQTTSLEDTNAASDFISSLKRSSRGRTLKPASSNLTANTSMNIYSYDMRGNFIGLASPVIDLTITSDTSGFLTSRNESVILGRRIKREPTERGAGEEKGTEGVVTREAAARRKKESKATQQQKEKDGSSAKAGQKYRRRKKHSVIPLALRKAKKQVTQEADTEQAGETSEAEDTSSLSEHGATAALRVEEEEESLQPEVDSREQELVAAVRRKKSGSKKSGVWHEEREGESSQAEADCERVDESVAAVRRRRKKSGSKKSASQHLPDSEFNEPDPLLIATAPTLQELPEPVTADFLVDTPRTTQDDVGAGKVKVLHKKAKKRVSISNEVVVIGNDKWGGGGERGGERGREGGGGGEWSKTELQKLSRVVLSVPALADNFWEIVAQRLGSGHSAAECSSEYAEIRKGQRRKKAGTGRGIVKEKTTHKAAPPPALTAKVGTMKRKRQVRDILDHLDSGHTDDIFDSTPFKKKSKLKNKQVEDIVEEEAEDEEEDDDHLVTTPREAFRRLGVPSTHTPRLCDYATTPDYKSGITQGVADHVIYRKQKAKKGPKNSKPSSKSNLPQTSSYHHPPLLKTQQRNSQPNSSTNLHSIHSGELTVLRRFEDSDDSCESNPFSDMEDACQDMIARLH